MAARVARHMSLARASIVVFAVVALLTALFMVKMSQGQAIPTSPTDSTKVPHYFGPWPNWALSPLTLPDATVTITGDGDGATAVATVGGNGAITGIAVTNPGNGYTTATVSITGAGTGAAATATITNSGAIVGIDVNTNGGGYTTPVVTIAGGGATTDATATAYGRVDSLTLQTPGTGYQFPTVDFDAPDDPNGVQAKAHAEIDAAGAVTAVVIDNPGSGYSRAPNVVIRDGTLMDPVANGGSGATAVATIDVQAVVPDTFGAGYTSAPTVTITDSTGAGAGATATARVDNGLVSAIAVDAAGSGYVTGNGIRKFQDQLPVLCDPAVANSCPDPASKFLPLGVPEEKVYNDPNNNPINSDEYEIALIQYRTKFNTDLPATLVRGYVQVETPTWLAAHPGVSQSVPLFNELLDGTQVPVMIDGVQARGVTSPQWLGPVIVATKNKPVRIVFRNLLPTGADGDLFLPTDSTLMGSGMGPMPQPDPVDEGTVMDGVRNPVCSELDPATGGKSADCFKDNRATLHLHGGISPWISDGTPHQWITPANEDTPWPEGVDVRYVPDMPVGNDPRDGVMTFYYTNQQSARLMFYHDHAWGITRLNVYAGEAAGYLITDKKEQELVTAGTIPAEQIPLIVQDRTFVPPDSQLYDTDGAGNVFGSPGFDPVTNGISSYGQDPTWDKSRWGRYGDFWYHHVYMPAQNPGDPGGMSAYGRWMYGPWFWPPAAGTKHGPIANPYYDPACNLNDPTTWTYQTDPFCEPQQIPGTPNLSAGMEQFNDTPIVNGVAYPEVTLQPQTYRFRVLNAANDRFFNFQWYVADQTTGTDSEVALDPQLLAAAQTDPVVFPTPVHNASTNGPDWIQIGTEGGFLPAPVVVDGQQETTWITDPTRFDVGNVDKHSLLLAPAERADVIVDFSQFAGKTLILYNDAPAAFPARVPSYDYYTGYPDLSPNGPSVILPGYGPNTRTIMRVRIAAAAPAPAFNLTRLRSAFSHKADGSGVFESSQHPIIVGQAAYNSAYGTSFSGASDCNAVGSTLQICDGFLRVNDTATFGFNTLRRPTTKSIMAVQPKAIHDEMNSTTFDEFGRMQANLGVEAQPPTPGLQNVTLYPFVNPVTELIDGTSLPKNHVVYDANGNPVDDVKMTPVASTQVGQEWRVTDGSQIWRVTHNGVDTHPIHFHLYDVQILNRVTWDNIIIPPDKEELGWKDTVRMAPLEDTIVALRPLVPELPWEIPNNIRNLNPMDPAGSPKLFFNVDPQGNPLPTAITNQLVNYGWGYVWHCHILSHEEMDMMRPQTLALPPVTPDGLSFTLVNGQPEITFNDNSITETAFVLQRDDGTAAGWTDVATLDMPLDQTNDHGVRTLADAQLAYDPQVVYGYRVVARNTVGYGNGMPVMTVQSVSAAILTGPAPAAPTGLTGIIGNSIDLTWTDNAADETGFTIQRAVNGGAWTNLTTVGPNTAADPTAIGPVNYRDATEQPGNSYAYRVRADNGAAASAWSNTFTIDVPAVPATPTGLTATLQMGATAPEVRLDFTDNATNETGFTVQRNDNGAGWVDLTTLAANPTTGAVTYTDTTVAQGHTYDYQVRAETGTPIVSAWSNTATVAVPTVPAAPTNLTAALQAGAAGPEVVLGFTDNSTDETGFAVERNDGTGWAPLTTLPANTVTYTDATVAYGASYDYRVRAVNGPVVYSAWSNTATVAVPAQPAAPSALSATLQMGATAPEVRLDFTDNATNETGFTVERNDGTGWALLTPLPASAAAAVTYTDTTVVPGATYDYRVRADNGTVVSSAWSNTATVAVPTVPAAPTNLTAALQAGAAGPEVVLGFTDNSTDETGFAVERNDGTGWAPLATLPANTVTYTDATVAYGASYDYRVRAVNGPVVYSAWSNTATVAVPAQPAAPSGLTATVQASAGGPQVAISLTDNAGNETSFLLQRRDNGGTWADLGALPSAAGSGTTVTYTDSTVAAGNTYDYRVRANNGPVVTSAWSNTATAAVPTVPAAPAGIAGTVLAGPSISLTWTDNANNEQGFTLQRSTGGGAWATIAGALPPNTVGYVDTTVSLGTAYTYQVRAYNVSGASAWNTSAAIAVPTPPAAPTSLARTIARTAAGPDTVNLTWTDNADNESGFVIQRATDTAFTADVMTFAAAANATTYTDAVAHGFTYYYRVQAVNVVAMSAWSNTVNVTTVPATPTNLAVTNIARTRLTLTWDDVSANETGYQIQQKRANNNNWKTITTTAANATSFRVINLSPDRAYDFRVRGVNGVGSSPWTASVRARTLP